MAQVFPRFFVEVEDAVVSQADFARLRIAAATGHGHHRDGVMRRSEGADGDEAAVG